MQTTSPSLASDDTRQKFRTLYLQGKKIKECLAILSIPEGTFDWARYTNNNGLRDWLIALENEKMLITARQNLQDFAELQVDSDDPRWAKLKYDASQYITDNLDPHFTKKEEKDKKTPVIVNLKPYGGDKIRLKPLKTNTVQAISAPDVPQDVLCDTPEEPQASQDDEPKAGGRGDC